MHSPSKPYDINFCFPVPEALESERVTLAPFIVGVCLGQTTTLLILNCYLLVTKPSKHASLFVDQAVLYPEVFRYLPFGPFENVDDFLTNLIDSRVSKDPGYILFAIYDKTRPAASNEHPGALAGLIGLINSSAANLVTEIGCVMILPPFQRTHVASNAVGILLHHTLDTSSFSRQVGGPNSSLGLRRIVWQANALNTPSVRLAERMGFAMEGLLKWDRVLQAEKDDVGNGIAIRDGDPREGCAGRHTALLSLCWDDWEKNGAREKVDEIMKRVK